MRFVGTFILFCFIGNIKCGEGIKKDSQFRRLKKSLSCPKIGSLSTVRSLSLKRWKKCWNLSLFEGDLPSQVSKEARGDLNFDK